MKKYNHIKQKIKYTILEKLAIQNTQVHHSKYMEKYNYRKQEIKIYTITEKKNAIYKARIIYTNFRYQNLQEDKTRILLFKQYKKPFKKLTSCA